LETLFGVDTAIGLGRVERAVFGALRDIFDPWLIVQVGVVLACLGAGRVLGTRLEKALEPRVRAVQGKPRLLRFLALLLRRTRWIVTALLLAVAALAFRAATAESRSVIVVVALGLIVAWIAISVSSRLIRNRTLGRFVAWLAWIYVALRITGGLDEAARALDSLAVRVGAFSVSLYDVIQATLVIAIVLWLAVVMGNFVERRVSANADLTPSLKVLIGKLAKVVLLTLAGAVALAALGIDLTALTVFSGALGVGIGFGLQKVVSNFVSGIIILLDKSLKPGDTISLGDTYGWIKELRARFVSVVTRDGRSYLIPNEDFITGRVVNWSFTATLVRIDVEFGVAYESDPHEVRRIAVEAAKTVERVQPRPGPVCHLTKFNDFSLDFILRFWIVDPQNGVTNVRGAVMLACWDSFRAAGIEFPAPQREIVVKRPVRVEMAADGAGEPAV
jgi:small-conductance mechanosensitive channel